MISGLWFVYGELRDFLARHGWSSGSNTISSKLTTSSTGSSSFSPSVWLLHSMKLDYQFMYSINHIAVFMFFLIIHVSHLTYLHVFVADVLNFMIFL